MNVVERAFVEGVGIPSFVSDRIRSVPFAIPTEVTKQMTKEELEKDEAG